MDTRPRLAGHMPARIVHAWKHGSTATMAMPQAGCNGRRASLALALCMASAMPVLAQAQGQCTPVLSGLRLPVAGVMSGHGNLFVAEAGDGSAGSGRISIVDPHGHRRTLIDGLPSAPADVGTPSGPSGLFLRGDSLYMVMGTGDTGVAGPRPGSTLPNPAGPSSPIFSSVLVMSFGFHPGTEMRTTGFRMTRANQRALAAHHTVWLHDHRGYLMGIRMVANFPNYAATPLPDVPDNISLSNPFGITGIGKWFYVTDGGRNLAWKVDSSKGRASPLVSFPDIANPLFPQVGGPSMQAVPTGISVSKGKLLVSLLRGAPFATGTSTVERIDPATGSDTTLISGLTTAIGTIPRKHGHHEPLLVLEHSSSGPFFSGPGTVLRFDGPASVPTTVADCLALPTSMTLDERTHRLYVTGEGGDLARVPAGNL